MIFATAAEYNPFHRGHKYHIKKMKEMGADGIISIMSPNFVQRAEPAVFNKFDRAVSAVKGGVDLVIELPTPYAVGSAERFAEGCVKIADKTGIVDKFCFGSENGNIEELKNLAEIIREDVFSEELKPLLKKGLTFASARAEAMKKLGFEAPKSPNDILAVEYIKAIENISSAMEPVTIKRIGEYHGSDYGFASASQIRKKLKENSVPEEDLAESTCEVYRKLKDRGLAPADISNLERSIIAFLRTADKKEIEKAYAVTEGVENRIAAASVTAESIDDLYEKVKTKRYTMSAVRRMILSAFLGIKKEKPEICCLRVLAFNKRGTELMKEIKKNSDLPLITVFDDSIRDEKIREYMRTEKRASDIFSVSTPAISSGFEDYTRKITVTE